MGNPIGYIKTVIKYRVYKSWGITDFETIDEAHKFINDHDEGKNYMLYRMATVSEKLEDK